MFGGELTLSTFAEFGMTDAPDADKIMHGQLETGAGYTIMAADVPSHMEYQAPAGFSVSLSGDDGDALRGYFEQLAAGGVTTMPLQKQVWGDEFGMCVDRVRAPPGWSTSPSAAAAPVSQPAPPGGIRPSRSAGRRFAPRPEPERQPQPQVDCGWSCHFRLRRP